MQLILETEPTVDIKLKMSTLARSQISDALANTEDSICALNKTSPTIVDDSKQPSKESEITLNNEQLENIMNDVDSISKTNGDVENKEQKLESEIKEIELDIILENVANSSAGNDQINGILTSTEPCVESTSNLADTPISSELLENSKESTGEDSADIVCIKDEEKAVKDLNFECEVSSLVDECASSTKVHNEKHSDANRSQDMSNGNGNIEVSVGDQSMITIESAFSPSSDTIEKDFNISAQLKQLEDDSTIDKDFSNTFLSDDHVNAHQLEKVIPTVVLKDNAQENDVNSDQKLIAHKNEMVESEITNEKLIGDNNQIKLSEKESEKSEVSVDHISEKGSEDKINVQLPEQEINDIPNVGSQKEKDLPSIVEVEQQSVESVKELGCMEVDNNSILTQDLLISVDNTDNVDKVSSVQTDIISKDNIDKSEEETLIVIKNVEVSETLNLQKQLTEDKKVLQIEETMDVDEVSAEPGEIPDKTISENVICNTQAVEKSAVVEINMNKSDETVEIDTAKNGEDLKVANDQELILSDHNQDKITLGSGDIKVIKNTNDIAVGNDIIKDITDTIQDEVANAKNPNKEVGTQNCNPVNSDSKSDDVHKVISTDGSVKQPIVEKPTKLVSDVEIMDEEDISVIEETRKVEVGKDKITEKKLPVVCKLSNTMDILSEDEDEPPANNKISEPKKNAQEENKCINIDDDDDIMFIEDAEESKVKSKKPDCKSRPETECDNEKKNTNSSKKCVSSVKDGQITPKISEMDEEKTSEIDHQKLVDTKPVETDDKEAESPILPKTFLKSVIKNLAEMTRNELEDFCVLKLVESVVDKGNLKEIKDKMKTMAQTIEDMRKKALLLTKQNRDLQVVIKTVQENQKKISPAPMLPMKITRSVGMQVVLSSVENANATMKKLTPPAQPASTPSRPARNVQSPKAQKPVANNIPVPRLVPASSPTNKPAPPVNNIAKPVTLVRTPPARPEKRPHNKLSPASSVTVDLTDDEPPAKVAAIPKNPTPPVRVVPSQSLMPAKPRQFGPTANGQRKVYIPISGAQTNGLRPPATVMKNFVQTPIPRPRAPTRMPNAIRMPQVNRHPAPLPDAMKQYQPPTWKALPPAPDLKLSKVDNGIVISWKFEGYQTDTYEEVASFQLYAYQETTAPPSTALWKKIGDIKALPLPMACTLTQFMSGFKYYFAVRAIDVRSRIGPFSLPGSIMLISKS